MFLRGLGIRGLGSLGFRIIMVSDERGGGGILI